MKTENQKKTTSRDNIILIMTILSGLGSFGSFVLNWLGVSALGENMILWFQGFAALTILLAVIFIGMEWDFDS